MLPYFIFNTYDSRDKYVVVNEYPSQTKPKAKVKELVVPGRGGALNISEGLDVYDNLVLTCQCTALPTADIETISAWLNGAGTLVFGNALTRAYKARVDAQISFDKILRGWAHRSFVIPFVCQPGRYVYPEVTDSVFTETDKTITNPGTMSSEPRVTIIGNGEVTVTVGDSTMLVTGPETAWTLVIDTELMDCFDDTGAVLRNEWLTGDFPRLLPGSNVVAFDGDVTSITIKPRWRYL